MGTLESTTVARADSADLIAVREPELPAAYVEPRWYAAYTWANHEKRVAEQLEGRAVEHFLPLYKSVRRWKDRRVRLELPLFPGYVFVWIPLRERLRVQQIPSVVHLVSFNGAPVPLPEKEIESIRRGLSGGLRAMPHLYLTVGRRVRITAGPLMGHEGVLVRRKGNLHVVLSIALIQRSIFVQIDSTDLEPLS